MKNALVVAAIAMLVPLSLPIFTHAQTTSTVVIVQDGSALGSPTVISGTIEIRETTMDSTVRVSLTENQITARNISSTTILTLVVWIDVFPAYGSPQRFVRQYECFFAPDVIKPSDEHLISQKKFQELVEPYNPEEPPRTPRAEAKIVYVQFLDGTIFGHEGFGANLQMLRRLTWKHLRRLDTTYRTRGEAAFLAELNDPVEPGEIDVLIENVRQTQRLRGTETAVAQIRGMLNTAKERQQGFRPSPSR